jgi:hypothetical protein
MGMKLPEKYKENFDVSAQGRLVTNVSTKSLRSMRRSSPCIFQVVVSLSIQTAFLLLTQPTPVQTTFKITSLRWTTLVVDSSLPMLKLRLQGQG